MGFFNSEIQRSHGQRGAAVNREQGTGGFDPANLQRANEELSRRIQENPDKYQHIRNSNLEKGRKTQRELGINLGNTYAQRLKSVNYHGIVLEGKRYYNDPEARTCICETTLEYYLHFAQTTRKKPTRKRHSSSSEFKDADSSSKNSV